MEGIIKSGKKNYGFLDKSHTEEAKKNIGIKNSIRQKGEKNSQFGKMWVYSDEIMVNKKISYDER